MTNGDKIRQMDDVELTCFLTKDFPVVAMVYGTPKNIKEWLEKEVVEVEK